MTVTVYSSQKIRSYKNLLIRNVHFIYYSVRENSNLSKFQKKIFLDLEIKIIQTKILYFSYLRNSRMKNEEENSRMANDLKFLEQVGSGDENYYLRKIGLETGLSAQS